MPRLTTLAAVAAAATAAAPALAQSSDNDVRCLILSHAFSRAAKQDQAKKVAEYSVAYFLGRVDTRFNAAQLRAAVTRQQQAMQRVPAAEAAAEMQGCARRVQASVQRLRTPAAAGQPKR